MSFDLLRKFRSLATLGVLCVLMLVGVTWGWSAVTAPLPKTEDPPLCETVTIPAGEKIYPDQVTVSVINAGAKDGLAGDTMQALVEAGFVEGELGNAPSTAGVTGAQIWTDDPKSSAARLVASYLSKNGRGVAIADEQTELYGINILVGDKFNAVVKGRKAVAAGADTTVCSPPADDE